MPFQIHVSLQNSGQELGTGQGQARAGGCGLALRAGAVWAVWAVVEGGEMRRTPYGHSPNPTSTKEETNTLTL